MYKEMSDITQISQTLSHYIETCKKAYAFIKHAGSQKYLSYHLNKPNAYGDLH